VAVTDAGRALEAALSGDQMRLLAESFAQAGPDAEAGWRHVMAALRAQMGVNSTFTWSYAPVNVLLTPHVGEATPRTPMPDGPGASIDSA
jgi:hypothetical protein